MGITFKNTLRLSFYCDALHRRIVSIENLIIVITDRDIKVKRFLFQRFPGQRYRPKLLSWRDVQQREEATTGVAAIDAIIKTNIQINIYQYMYILRQI